MKKIIIGLMAMVLSFSSWAKSDGEYIAQFLVAVNKGTTLQGSFSQQVLDAKGRSYNKVQGTFIVKRPGKFIWQYAGKHGQKIVSTGKRVWIEQPDLKQVSHISIQRVVQSSPAAILFDPTQLTKQFKIIPLKETHLSGLEWIELRPFNKKGMQFEKLTVGVKQGRINQVRVLDAFGQVTVISFLTMQFDAPVNDALFNYQPPSDYDKL